MMSHLLQISQKHSSKAINLNKNINNRQKTQNTKITKIGLHYKINEVLYIDADKKTYLLTY